jgi:hypothetical protein
MEDSSNASKFYVLNDSNPIKRTKEAYHQLVQTSKPPPSSIGSSEDVPVASAVCPSPCISSSESDSPSACAYLCLGQILPGSERKGEASVLTLERGKEQQRWRGWSFTKGAAGASHHRVENERKRGRAQLPATTEQRARE